MMSAAASMTIQAGDMVASHTPMGEVQAPPRPAARPRDGTHVLCRTCDTAPETEVGMMVKSDVAVDMMGLMPNARRNIGTRTVPPPIPSMPERIPMPMPTRAGITSEVKMSMGAPASPFPNQRYVRDPV